MEINPLELRAGRVCFTKASQVLAFLLEQAMDTRQALVTAFGLLLLPAVLLSPVACTMRRHALISEAIHGGVDPIAARCAIDPDDMRDAAICMAAALRSKP